jgi:ketosteroid isomerase-like protein
MLFVNHARFLLVLGGALALLGCAQKAPESAGSDIEAVNTIAAGWEKAYNEKNADAVAALYSEDAQLLPPGAAVVNGHAAIKDFWANDIATGWGQITITSDAGGTAGEWAWRAGAFSVQVTPVVTGKYVEVWHKTADGWRLHRDIWNSDAAPTTAEAPPAQ